MASVVEICNMALSRIGNSQHIDSLEERSVQAEQCSLFYELSRDAVLRDFNWPFATKFVVLAEVAANPDPVNPYSYALPIDCLKVRRIVDQIQPASMSYVGAWADEPIHLYRRELPYRLIQGESTRLIATSISPATLEYTARIEEPGLFDAMFVSALAWKLAAELALPLAKEQNVAASCEQQYQAKILAAAAASFNEGAGNGFPESVFIQGRY